MKNTPAPQAHLNTETLNISVCKHPTPKHCHIPEAHHSASLGKLRELGERLGRERYQLFTVHYS